LTKLQDPIRHRRCSRSLRLATLGCCVALLGCRTPEPATRSVPEPAPVAPPLRAADSDRTTIAAPRFAPLARYSAERGGHAVLVVEGDQVVFAQGQNGHAIDAPHPLYNASESFWGAVALAAETDGYLDLDEPVAFTLPEFADAGWKQDIRVRHLLSYTSGLEAGVWPLSRDVPHDRFQRSLSLEVIAPPGERFQYGPSHLAVFGELLRRKLEPEGLDAVDYLERRILDPIGANLGEWRRDGAGNPDLAEGGSATARDWARFGQWLRDRGSWRGETIVKASQLAPCFVGSAVRPDFGLAVWLNPTGLAPVADPVVMAAGTGNQRLYVVPSLDLVAVRFGREDRTWRDNEFLSLLADAHRLSVPPREPEPLAN